MLRESKARDSRDHEQGDVLAPWEEYIFSLDRLVNHDYTGDTVSVRGLCSTDVSIRALILHDLSQPRSRRANLTWLSLCAEFEC